MSKNVSVQSTIKKESDENEKRERAVELCFLRQRLSRSHWRNRSSCYSAWGRCFMSYSLSIILIEFQLIAENLKNNVIPFATLKIAEYRSAKKQLEVDNSNLAKQLQAVTADLMKAHKDYGSVLFSGWLIDSFFVFQKVIQGNWSSHVEIRKSRKKHGNFKAGAGKNKEQLSDEMWNVGRIKAVVCSHDNEGQWRTSCTFWTEAANSFGELQEVAYEPDPWYCWDFKQVCRSRVCC